MIPAAAVPQAPMPGPSTMPFSFDDEPASKRLKTEESLIPEDKFLVQYPSPVHLYIQLPNVPEKPEWQLRGQTLSLTLPLTDPVRVSSTGILMDTKTWKCVSNLWSFYLIIGLLIGECVLDLLSTKAFVTNRSP